MEAKFIAAWMKNREEAAKIGVRIRPVPENATVQAQRMLTGTRPSDGFYELAAKGRLDLSLEALAVSRAFTGLFTDEQANTALTRLLENGYKF